MRSQARTPEPDPVGEAVYRVFLIIQELKRNETDGDDDFGEKTSPPAQTKPAAEAANSKVL